MKGGKRKGAGRPKGSGYLNKTRLKLLEHSDDIIDALIKQAVGGDLNAIKLCVERLIPIPKEAPLFVSVNDNADLPEQLKEIQVQVLNGELSIQDALEQIKALSVIDKAIKKVDLSFM